MSVSDGGTNLDEQRQPLLQARALLRAIVGNGQSFDVFHHHVRALIVGDAAVVEPRDARMLQARENLSFGFESLQLRDRLASQQLDRDSMFEVALRAGRLVYVAHATVPDQTHDAPNAETRTGRSVLERIVGAAPRSLRQKII